MMNARHNNKIDKSKFAEIAYPAVEYVLVVHVQTSGANFETNGIVSISAVLSEITRYPAQEKLSEIDKFYINIKLPDKCGYEQRAIDEFWSKNTEYTKFVRQDAREPEEAMNLFVSFLNKTEKYCPQIVSDNPSFHVGWINYYLSKYSTRSTLDYALDGKYRVLWDVHSMQKSLLEFLQADYQSEWGLTEKLGISLDDYTDERDPIEHMEYNIARSITRSYFETVRIIREFNCQPPMISSTETRDIDGHIMAIDIKTNGPNLIKNAILSITVIIVDYQFRIKERVLVCLQAPENRPFDSACYQDWQHPKRQEYLHQIRKHEIDPLLAMTYFAYYLDYVEKKYNIKEIISDNPTFDFTFIDTYISRYTPRMSISFSANKVFRPLWDTHSRQKTFVVFEGDFVSTCAFPKKLNLGHALLREHSLFNGARLAAFCQFAERKLHRKRLNHSTENEQTTVATHVQREFPSSGKRNLEIFSCFTQNPSRVLDGSKEVSDISDMLANITCDSYL
jgi:hypothetical protein